ncbi:MAG: leucine-rich repeat domain-containing protein [Erysipelotrichaceae bacterium]|nr:leucine-rich repeat domain-containing protein [Erysipelotrichaceae bacterium]
MKKNKLFVLLATLTLGVTALAGCDHSSPDQKSSSAPSPSQSQSSSPSPSQSQSSSSSSSVHTHTFSNTWTYDETYHWHAATCQHTELVNDKAEHEIGEWQVVTPAGDYTDGLERRSCNVCEYHEDRAIESKEKQTIKGLKFEYIEDKDEYIIAGFDDEDVEELVLPSMHEGKKVTAIKSAAFFNFAKLTKVVIPEGIEEINNEAFSKTALLTIKIPNSVTKIGASAFNGCSRLVQVELGTGVLEIGERAFYEANVNSIVNHSTLNIVAGRNYASSYISNYALEVVDDIANSTLRTTEDGLYYLLDVVENNETHVYLVEYIGDGLNVVFPDGVTHLANPYPFKSVNRVVRFEINKELKTLAYNAVLRKAFEVINHSTEVTINKSTFSNAYVIYNAPKSEEEDPEPIPQTKLHIENGFVMYRYESGKDYLLNYVGEEKKITVPASVYEVLPSAFEGTDIEEVKFTSRTAILGEYAFRNCMNLKRAELTNNLFVIGTGAFYNCQKLEEVTNLAPDLSGYTFYECVSLKSLPGYTPVEIGSYDFYDCKSLNTFTVYRNTSFGTNSFSGCTGLIEVINRSATKIVPGQTDNGYVAYYAKRVTMFGESTVKKYDDGGLTVTDGDTVYYIYRGEAEEVVVPEGVTVIGSGAFGRNETVKKIILPSTVKEIGGSAFEKCVNLKELNLPEGLEKIGDYAFVDCGLEKVIIPSTVTELGRNLFASYDDYPGVKEVVFNNDVDLGTTPYSLFNGSLINKVSFGEAVTRYATNEAGDAIYSQDMTTLFYHLKGATEPYATPESVTTIEAQAFYGNKNECITISKNVATIKNTPFSNANIDKIVYDAEQATGSSFLNGIEGNVKELVIGENVRVIPSYAFNNTRKVLKLTFQEGVTEISDNAFSGLRKVSNLVLPNSLTTIGNAAFMSSSDIRQITLGTGLVAGNIANNAFDWLDNVIEVINKSSIEITAGGNACGNVAHYAKSVVADATDSIMTYTNDGFLYYTYTDAEEVEHVVLLSYSGNAEKVKLPDPITEIDADQPAIFQLDDNDKNNIKELVLNDKLKVLPSGFCNFLISLESLTVGEGLESYSYYSFVSNANSSRYNPTKTLIWKAVNAKDSSGSSSAMFANVTNVTFGDKVEEIPDYLLMHSNVSEVSIPKSVKVIGKGAFEYSTVEKITFEEGSLLEQIKDYAFAANSYFGENEYSYLVGIVLPNTEGQEITLGKSAFAHQHNLEKVELHNVKVLPEYVLADTNLKSIDLTGVEEIGQDALTSSLVNVTKFVIPDSVKKIGYNAFRVSDGSKLLQVTIGSGVETMGSYPFEGHSNLVEVINKSSYSEDALKGYFASKPNIIASEADSTLVFHDDGFVTIETSKYFGGQDNDVNLLVAYLKGDDNTKELTIPDYVTALNAKLFMTNLDGFKLEKLYFGTNIVYMSQPLFLYGYGNSTVDLYFDGTQEQYQSIAVSSSGIRPSNFTLNVHYANEAGQDAVN